MFDNLNKGIIKIVLIILVIMSASISYSESIENNMDHFNLLNGSDNINDIEDTSIYKEFLKKDKEYLEKNNLSKETIQKEISAIDDKIYEFSGKYIKTNKGAILYSPNIVGNIHILSTAKNNRIEMLNSPRVFRYKEDVIYFPRKKVLGTYKDNISPEVLKIVYEEVENVLDNIEVEDDFLKNIVISVSPFDLRGINAFTEVYDIYNDGITIVMGSGGIKNTSNIEYMRESIRSTLLHELGHVVHYKSTLDNDNMKDKNSKFWKEYNSIYGNELNFTYSSKNNTTSSEDWVNDCAENFAEDFKVYFSNKLGKYSFESQNKLTAFEYNDEVESFIDKYIELGDSLEEPGIYKSAIVKDDYEIPIDDWSNKSISREGVEKLDIKYDNKDRGGYVEVWSKDNRLIEKVSMKEEGSNNLEIDIDDNTGVLVKYVKINNSYKVLWRRDID